MLEFQTHSEEWEGQPQWVVEVLNLYLAGVGVHDQMELVPAVFPSPLLLMAVSVILAKLFSDVEERLMT